MSTIDGGKNIILDKLIYYLDSANSKSLFYYILITKK